MMIIVDEQRRIMNFRAFFFIIPVDCMMNDDTQMQGFRGYDSTSFRIGNACKHCSTPESSIPHCIQKLLIHDNQYEYDKFYI